MDSQLPLRYSRSLEWVYVVKFRAVVGKLYLNVTRPTYPMLLDS